MDSQTAGTLVAAVITAGAGLVAASSARRTSFRRRQRQHMREEADLLAALPKDHPMHGELSRVIEVRLRGYTRLFDRAVKRETNPIVPRAITVAGVVVILATTAADKWLGMSTYLFEVFTGDIDWSKSHLKQIVGVGFLVIGFLTYVRGLFAISEWTRIRTWKRAMRGEEIDPLRGERTLETDQRVPKRRRLKESTARWREKQRDKIRWFDGPMNF